MRDTSEMGYEGNVALSGVLKQRINNTNLYRVELYVSVGVLTQNKQDT